MAPLVTAPPSPPKRGGLSSVADVPPSPIVGGTTFSLHPVVLRVLPLRGSPAPVGFIYDETPDPVDGGLLAAASAFFSHQGHQVYHDPCPDLAEYCCVLGVPMALVVPVDRLPDYLLSSGLELMAGLRALSPTDNTFGGMAFMAAYLSPSASGPPSVGVLRGPSVGASLGPSSGGGLTVVGPPASTSAQFMGGLSATPAWISAPPPVSMGGSCRPGGSSSSCFGRSSGSGQLVSAALFYEGFGSVFFHPCTKSVRALVSLTPYGSWGVSSAPSGGASCASPGFASTAGS